MHRKPALMKYVNFLDIRLRSYLLLLRSQLGVVHSFAKLFEIRCRGWDLKIISKVN